MRTSNLIKAPSTLAIYLPGTCTPYTLLSTMLGNLLSSSATSVVATFSPFHLQKDQGVMYYDIVCFYHAVIQLKFINSSSHLFFQFHKTPICSCFNFQELYFTHFKNVQSIKFGSIPSLKVDKKFSKTLNLVVFENSKLCCSQLLTSL